MKTAFDINDLWDALDTRAIWKHQADAERNASSRRRNALKKLKALTGGAG